MVETQAPEKGLPRASTRPRDSAGRPRRRIRRVEAERLDLATVLTLVRSGKASTRHEIEELSGLGRAVVADRLATLFDFGLLEEGDLGPANGGRAPRLVRFRAGGGVVILAVLDQSTLGVGIADLSGRLILEHHEAVPLTGGPDAIFERLGTLFDWIIDQHGGSRQVWGIGVGVPAPVELAKQAAPGLPALQYVPIWPNHPMVEHLAVRYNTPVWLHSSVEMMTLGELHKGSGVGAKDLLFVKLGSGISAGLVCDGRVYRGAQGGAGLIGHFSVGESDRTVCHCGNIGCLETIAGGEAIAREGKAAAEEARSQHLGEILARTGVITATDVAHAAQLGDSFSAELLARCGRLVGTALAGLTNALNPSLIVLGGSLAQASDILLAAVREAVYRRSHPLLTRDLRITRSQMGNTAGLVGLALEVVEDIFTATSLHRWISYGSPLRGPGLAELLAQANRTIEGADQLARPPTGDEAALAP